MRQAVSCVYITLVPLLHCISDAARRPRAGRTWNAARAVSTVTGVLAISSRPLVNRPGPRCCCCNCNCTLVVLTPLLHRLRCSTTHCTDPAAAHPLTALTPPLLLYTPAALLLLLLMLLLNTLVVVPVVLPPLPRAIYNPLPPPAAAAVTSQALLRNARTPERPPPRCLLVNKCSIKTKGAPYRLVSGDCKSHDISSLKTPNIFSENRAEWRALASVNLFAKHSGDDAGMDLIYKTRAAVSSGRAYLPQL